MLWHTQRRVGFLALLCAMPLGPLLAQVSEPHPVRAPFVLETTSIADEQYVVASASETSIVAYREAFLSSRILAKRSDGRGLPTTWIGAEVVSSNDTTPRELHRDSLHVVGDLGFCVWLEDEGSDDHTRLHSNRLIASSWQTPTRVNDSLVPQNHDIVDFACAARTGPNGKVYVAIVFTTADIVTGAEAMFGVISADNGQTFNAPFPLASAGAIPGGNAKRVGGLAVDLKGGELHVAWTDDRNDVGHRVEVFYRRALLDYFGNPIFLAPLGTGFTDVKISAVDDVVGDPILAVDDDPYSLDGFGKHVGIAWRELDKGVGLPTLRLRASHDSGTNFLPEHVVAHTSTAGDAVADFDFEILGGRYVVTFEDNAVDVGGFNVFVFPVGVEQVWRAISEDGTDFSSAGEGIVTMVSAFSEPTAHGKSPSLARAAGVVDAGILAFLEEGSQGAEVRTAFSDQLDGGAFHIDDEPVVSKAQSGAIPRELKRPRVAYNPRYSNYLVAWQQEVTPDSGIFQLMLGGYRPQTALAVGWNVGSTELHFELHHVPFNDSFAFVLISGATTENPALGFFLPDGRRTGLMQDIFQQVGLSNFVLFLARNDPVIEGAATLSIPLPPGFVTPGIPLSYCGVTWGIGGALHVVTDFVKAQS